MLVKVGDSYIGPRAIYAICPLPPIPPRVVVDYNSGSSSNCVLVEFETYEQAKEYASRLAEDVADAIEGERAAEDDAGEIKE